MKSSTYQTMFSLSNAFLISRDTEPLPDTEPPAHMLNANPPPNPTPHHDDLGEKAFVPMNYSDVDAMLEEIEYLSARSKLDGEVSKSNTGKGEDQRNEEESNQQEEVEVEGRD